LTGKTRKERNKQRLDFALENVRRTATNELTKDKIRKGKIVVGNVLAVYSAYKIVSMIKGVPTPGVTDAYVSLKNFISDRKFNNYGGFDPKKIINIKP
jgi:hypothetical protein